MLDEAKAELDLVYGEVEKTAAIVMEDRPMPETVLAADDAKAVVQLLLILHCGVFA